MIALGCSRWIWDWDDCFREGLQTAIEWAFGKFFDFIFQAIANIVVSAVEAVLKAVGLLWVYIKIPNAEQTPISWVQDHTNFIMAFIATLSVIFAAIQMAFSHRGEPVREILKSLLTLAVVTAGATAFAWTLISAADDFSAWIIDQALKANGHSFAKNLADMMTDPLKSPTEEFGWLLVIFVGILMVFTSIVQLALMIVRYGMLVLLVGVLPLTAAATNTEMGMMWFKRSLGWLAGFIIYKPVAALIYATALYLMSTPTSKDATPGTSQTLKIIMGVTMMIVAVVALPAILRFVSPRTS
ncbi:type IV secretion system protein [Kribbella kalugense]|uniref:TrbL/VirB6 plasmid conjugal transfer protein n=1 Tax=Kribbella kalugense TaxID=2512221 RepID=A0A4R7ZLB3_9ACTN|nr:type IV secretion system protein [Kribbella kalugense]TDW18036.1 TrbL/VirB6 plasmid conjugal transfer protein [Kribbella kalugense]